MIFIVKLIAFLAFILACTWLVLSPGFDSGVATAAALAAFFGSLLIKKKPEESSQTQNISGGSQGIQAGRDVHVSKKGED
nr:hypothetical protein [uncultured Glaciecola sp.]